METLKSFIANELNLTGKWTSPGGDVKAFTNDNDYITEDETIKIKWYQGKKILTIQGVKSQDIEDKIRDEMQKISHTGEGESKDEQDNVSLDQTALNQTELQHLHSEKLIEAINDIKGQIQKLKIDTKENQTSISKLTALSQVAHPKPDESFELHKLRQENEDYRCQNENLLRENAEKTWNSKKTWNIINELTSRKQHSSHVKEIELNGCSISGSQKLSEAFNDHFADIGPKLADKIPCNENSRSHLDYLSSNESGASTSFQLKTTSSSIVFSLLSKLSKSKATGLDKISARLLRECPDLISDSLSIIFNRSIITGIFPDDWKCSKVIPLFKQGKRKDLNNYRPISIIPIVAKVFERIIYDQVNFFLTDNKLLSTSQSGFRSLHSTVTALLEATNDWAYNIDHGNVNAVVFLDLKKAFDTVDHAIILSKLNAYGIGSEWFKSYLSDRNQKCFVNGFLSPNRSLSCGIPQGTILGPLLFLIYINDLPNCLEHSQARMYADDTHLTLASNNVRDINQNLNQDLVNVSEWLIANKLTLNQSKTEFMLIGSRQRLCTLSPLPSLEIDGIPVNQVSLTKSLGVLIDENLSWNMHINKLIKKIASSIGAIKRLRPFVPFTTLQYIYNSLVQPHFNYCCVVWDNCNKTYADKLQ